MNPLAAPSQFPPLTISIPTMKGTNPAEMKADAAKVVIGSDTLWAVGRINFFTNKAVVALTSGVVWVDDDLLGKTIAKVLEAIPLAKGVAWLPAKVLTLSTVNTVIQPALFNDYTQRLTALSATMPALKEGEFATLATEVRPGTPLIHALVQGDDVEFLKVMLSFQQGEDDSWHTLSDASGNAAIHYVKSVEMLLALREAGVPLDTINAKRETLFHILEQRNTGADILGAAYPHLPRAILAHKDSSGRTLFDYASANGVSLEGRLALEPSLAAKEGDLLLGSIAKSMELHEAEGEFDPEVHLGSLFDPEPARFPALTESSYQPTQASGGKSWASVAAGKK